MACRKQYLSPIPSSTTVSIACTKHTAVDFFNQVNMLYSTVTEFCSPIACPTMSAGQRYEYLWADPTPTPGKPRGEPLKMSAPEYVDTLMTYIQSRIDDEATFPSKIGAPFPKQFGVVVRTIWRRLFRVYAHVLPRFVFLHLLVFPCLFVILQANDRFIVSTSALLLDLDWRAI